MNSSPPPPSFTLPPLTSAGTFPITPSPTPSPTDKADFRLGNAPKANKVKHVVEGDGERVSMYVKLFDGAWLSYVAWIELTGRDDPDGAGIRGLSVHAKGGMVPALHSRAALWVYVIHPAPS